MRIHAFEPAGFDGELVTVEVDIRRGIPSFDVIGLPDGAVREARDRVRAAIRNSGFEFPLDRVLVNLAPAALHKGGSGFDLPIAIALLVASGQVPDPGIDVLALGELELSGRVRRFSGVLAAVAAGSRSGVRVFLVSEGSLREARAPGYGTVYTLERLDGVHDIAFALRSGGAPRIPEPEIEEPGSCAPPDQGDLSDVKGHIRLKRALEVAASGGHHMLVFGPPGVGKTMAIRRLCGLLPDLDREESLDTTRIHSLAGLLSDGARLITRPPFRMPHHGASAEGLSGGGRNARPGEASLAHHGVLFLDEAAEFSSDALQALREPLEEGQVSISRASGSVWYPSRFMLVLACNPCPCGNLGRPDGVCLCSEDGIRKYWKRLGGPLLDRMDIRIAVHAEDSGTIFAAGGESTLVVRERVRSARARQKTRYSGGKAGLNGTVPPSWIDASCPLSGATRVRFADLAASVGLSSRACHSILRVSRTIADLAGTECIEPAHVEEAFGLRRYGDGSLPWVIP